MDTPLIPIVGMLIPIIIVPTALGFKHARFLRQVEHDERMKAMELGRTLAEDQSWTPGSLAALIGAGVPIGSMLIALAATKSFAATGERLIQGFWQTAAMIGVAGVICGSILAFQSFARQLQTSTNDFESKPEFDPEAFDVVGRRG